MNVVTLNDNYVLIPHQPDWKDGIRARRRWWTEASEALRGGEERLALRGGDWLEMTWTIDAWTHGEKVRLDERLRAAKKTGLAIAPRWGRADRLTNSGTGSTVTVQGGHDWNVNDYIFFQLTSPSEYDAHELRVITAVDGQDLTLDVPLALTYPAGALVWPMIGGKFSTRDIAHWSDRTGAISITLLHMGEALLGTPSAPSRVCEEGEIIEDFVEYSEGSISSFDGGCGWDGAGVIAPPFARQVVEEGFDYDAGAADDESMTGGTGWNGAPVIYTY